MSDWQRYEVIEPERKCVSPDGHDRSIEDRTYASCIPQGVLCSRCGKAWTIIVLPAEGA